MQKNPEVNNIGKKRNGHKPKKIKSEAFTEL